MGPCVAQHSDYLHWNFIGNLVGGQELVVWEEELCGERRRRAVWSHTESEVVVKNGDGAYKRGRRGRNKGAPAGATSPSWGPRSFGGCDGVRRPPGARYLIIITARRQLITRCRIILRWLFMRWLRWPITSSESVDKNGTRQVRTRRPEFCILFPLNMLKINWNFSSICVESFKIHRFRHGRI